MFVGDMVTRTTPTTSAGWVGGRVSLGPDTCGAPLSENRFTQITCFLIGAS